MGAATDFLYRNGFAAKVSNGRVVVSPASRLTPDVIAFIKSHRKELLAELAANDGETRRAAWDVLIPGYGQRRMIGEPCTHAEAMAYARGIWPDAEVLK